MILVYIIIVFCYKYLIQFNGLYVEIYIILITFRIYDTIKKY